MAFCEEAFKAGLRIPLYPFIARFLRRYGFVLTQIHSNAWRFILSYLIKCAEVSFSSTISVIRGLITLKKGPRSNFYYYESYKDTSLSLDQPKSIKE